MIKIVKNIILIFLEGFVPFFTNSDVCALELINESMINFKNNKFKKYLDIIENIILLSIFNVLGSLIAFLLSSYFLKSNINVLSVILTFIFNSDQNYILSKYDDFKSYGNLLILIKSFAPGSFCLITYFSGTTNIGILRFALAVFLSKIIKFSCLAFIMQNKWILNKQKYYIWFTRTILMQLCIRFVAINILIKSFAHIASL